MPGGSRLIIFHSILQILVTYSPPARLVLGLENGTYWTQLPAAASLLHNITASQALPSSGIVVLTFSDGSAMDQAMAVLSNTTGRACCITYSLSVHDISYESCRHVKA